MSAPEAHPCPFCGSTSIDDEQGETYRWRRAFCADCGARGGEVRTMVTGSGANTRALADARRAAFEEWNTRAQPPAPPVPAQPSEWVEKVMEQAQVFASAWSLVGGRFDSGNLREEAEEAKAELRAMLATRSVPEVPVAPFHNPWRTSLENCISGDNYLRASEYHDLIEELDDLYRIRAGHPAMPAAVEAREHSSGQESPDAIHRLRGAVHDEDLRAARKGRES